MERKYFGKINPVIDCPHLLDVQVESFRNFVQEKVPTSKRRNIGLQFVLNEYFPVFDIRETRKLEFLYYNIDVPRHSIEECRMLGLTYSKSLTARLRFSLIGEEQDLDEAIEQDVYLGDLPWMTEYGTFVINGAERVVVSQLHRSPGVFFSQNTHPNGSILYSAVVIPFRGLWIEFTTDIRNVLWAYIDKKNKIPATTLLRAIGYETDEELLAIFNVSETVKLRGKNSFKNKIVGKLLAIPIYANVEGEVVNDETGEVTKETSSIVLFGRDHIFEEADFDALKEHSVSSICLQTLSKEDSDISLVMNTLRRDVSYDKHSALVELYFQVRGVDLPDSETGRQLLERLFFSEKKYDLGDIGRYRINKRLKLEVDINVHNLTNEDILATLKEVIRLYTHKFQVDDIDHLSNRRIRTVGEQIQNQFSIGLARVARTIKERMNNRNAEQLTPQDMISVQASSRVINSFFGTSQLSQFMDQTNPLAALTHKRRSSALGPGGLSRERAGFEVRDIHYSHYGRLCSIETPEGPNIGLISSLCVYAQINDFGFIETPYRKVIKGRASKKISYLAAEQEGDYVIAQANALLDDKDNLVGDKIFCRYKDNNVGFFSSKEVDYMDVNSNQITSIAASLIPFVEHDDANRALMGANMQRQAVPLIRAESPIVGTGMERRVASDTGVIIRAEEKGEILYSSAEKNCY